MKQRFNRNIDSGLFQKLIASIELEQRFHFATQLQVIAARAIQKSAALVGWAIDGALEQFR
jgi:hypothetical protein